MSTDPQDLLLFGDLGLRDRRTRKPPTQQQVALYTHHAVYLRGDRADLSPTSTPGWYDRQAAIDGMAARAIANGTTIDPYSDAPERFKDNSTAAVIAMIPGVRDIFIEHTRNGDTVQHTWLVIKKAVQA